MIDDEWTPPEIDVERSRPKRITRREEIAQIQKRADEYFAAGTVLGPQDAQRLQELRKGGSASRGQRPTQVLNHRRSR